MTESRQDCEQLVREVLGQQGGLGEHARTLGDQEPLFDHGLTSLASARVMLGLEHRLGVEFPEQLLSRETFSSIGRLAEVCAELRAGVSTQ